MKAKQLREMSDEQLADTLRDRCQGLFRLRFQSTTEKLDTPSELRKLRKDIARIRTLIRERELKQLRGAG